MADFKIQRGTAQIASSVSSITLTAGSDYDAPGSASSAFIRLTGHRILGSGMQADDTSGLLHRNSAVFTNPGNIVTSVTLANGSGTANYTVEYEWEIIEYIGAASGPNEFIVREVGVIQTSASSDLTETSAGGASATDDNDVVVFITAQCQVGAGARGDYAPALFTASWDGGTGVVTITRGSAGGTARLAAASYAVVEFTGSNWTVQRITHDQTAVGTESETITDVGALTRAFIHIQQRANYATDPRHSGAEVWLSDTDELSFSLDYCSSTRDFVVWVVSNSETGTGAMNVLRYSGSRASNTGANPDRWDETVTAVADLTATSIMGECCNVGSAANSDSHIAMLAFKLTADDTLRLNRGRDLAERDWRVEIVEWPAASSGYTLTTDHGALTLSGQAVTLRVSRRLTATHGTYTLTGQVVGLRAARKVAANHGVYALAGQAVGLRSARKVAAAHGTYTLTGQAVSLRAARRVVADYGSLALDGQVVDLVYTPISGYTLVAEYGSLALAGQDVALRAARRLAADHGALALSGQAVGLRTARKLIAAHGTLTLSGQAMSLRRGAVLVASHGSLTLAGQAVALRAARRLLAAHASIAVAGQVVLLVYSGARDFYVSAILTFVAETNSTLAHRNEIDASLAHRTETDATLTHHTDD